MTMLLTILTIGKIYWAIALSCVLSAIIIWLNGKNILAKFNKDPMSKQLEALLEASKKSKENEEAFIKKLELYEHTEHLAKIGGWWWDLTKNPDEVSYTTNFANIFDVIPHQVVTAHTLMKIVHIDDRDKLNVTLSNCVEHGIAYDIQYRIVRRNDRNDLIRSVGAPIKNENGKTISIKGVIFLIQKDVD